VCANPLAGTLNLPRSLRAATPPAYWLQQKCLAAFDGDCPGSGGRWAWWWVV